MGTAAHVFAPGLLLALSRDAFSPEAAPDGGGTPTKAQFIPCKMLSLLRKLTSSACPSLQTQWLQAQSLVPLTISKIIAGGPANRSGGSDTVISPSSLHVLCSVDFSPIWFMRQWQRCSHALFPSCSTPAPTPSIRQAELCWCRGLAPTPGAVSVNQRGIWGTTRLFACLQEACRGVSS